MLRGITSLSQLGSIVAEERSALLDDTIFNAKIDKLAGTADAFAKHDVKLCLAEWRCNLVLYNLHAHLVTQYLIAGLDAGHSADIEAYRCIELQGIAACRCLRIAKHDTNLFAKLIDEDAHGLGLIDSSGELAQSLAHQSGLQSHFVVTHISLNLCLWSQSGYRVNDDDVDSSRTNQVVCNLESLLAIVGLGDKKVVGIYTQLLGIEAVKSVLCIDECSYTSPLLSLCNSMDGQSGLT